MPLRAIDFIGAEVVPLHLLDIRTLLKNIVILLL